MILHVFLIFIGIDVGSVISRASAIASVIKRVLSLGMLNYASMAQNAHPLIANPKTISMVNKGSRVIRAGATATIALRS